MCLGYLSLSARQSIKQSFRRQTGKGENEEPQRAVAVTYEVRRRLLYRVRKIAVVPAYKAFQ